MPMALVGGMLTSAITAQATSEMCTLVDHPPPAGSDPR
jgi:hypothetical protein